MKKTILITMFLIGTVWSTFARGPQGEVDENGFRVHKNNGEIIITEYIGEERIIVIPNNITAIGGAVFDHVLGITIPDNIIIELNSIYPIVYRKYNSNGKKAATFNITLSVYDEYEIAILDFSEIEIINYKGNQKDVTIPGKINDLPVTSIGYSAFHGKQLNSVIIPDSIVVIGNDAFFSNNLTNVYIPDSVAIIGTWAFNGNPLSNINLPSSVIIDNFTFYNDVILTRR
ncbi:MAG: leucine-rich repeat domain-containing protein [Treponema sp.]|jgi:hypothetical protein|nr:leucine-rich repeat domain-containing protein [Treponema sp.]